MKTMVPSEFYLGQNYPNPFNGKTTIKFCLARRTPVKVDVCNCESRMVRNLVDEEREAGTYEIEFDGSGMSEGSYICILQAGDFVTTKRMMLKKEEGDLPCVRR